jgi:hypothetical protein
MTTDKMCSGLLTYAASCTLLAGLTSVSSNDTLIAYIVLFESFLFILPQVSLSIFSPSKQIPG